MTVTLPDPRVNPSTWYISVLIWCYVLFYFLIFIAKNLKANPIWGFVTTIFLAFVINTAGWNMPLLNSNVSRGYISFSIGVIMGYIIPKLQEEPKYHNVYRLIKQVSLFWIILFAVLFCFYRDPLNDGMEYLLVLLLYPSIIIVFQQDNIEKILHHKFISFIGNATYDVYIWHFVFMTSLGMLSEHYNLEIAFNLRSTMISVAVIIFIIGSLSYRYIERPLTRFIENKYFI